MPSNEEVVQEPVVQEQAAPEKAINTEKEYVLGRDVAATQRLHVQHYYVGLTQGYQLDPVIVKEVSLRVQDDKISVADAGAGTAIWSAEIATLLGERCSVDAIDISDALFPHSTCLPRNVNLIGGTDLIGELDSRLRNKYDIIQARFFTLVIRYDATPLIQNLYDMCRPGGWVQFVDADMDKHHIIYPDGIDPKSTKQGTQGVLDGFRNFLNLVGIGGETFAWQKELENVFRKVGFTEFMMTIHKAAEPIAAYNSDQLLALGEELAKGALRLGADKGTDTGPAQRLMDAVAAGKEETQRGIHMNWTLMTIRAQRPLEA